ncbi:hypothetical protein PIB30_091160, partial [Stylosanthes scabra]|nr:hypothetical protein [Stylosanthes scabra]
WAEDVTAGWVGFHVSRIVEGWKLRVNVTGCGMWAGKARLGEITKLGAPLISWALEARNVISIYLGTAEPEISHEFKSSIYLGTAESEIAISGLQSPR